MTTRLSKILLSAAVAGTIVVAASPVMAQARRGHADQALPPQSYGIAGYSTYQSYGWASPYQTYGMYQGGYGSYGSGNAYMGFGWSYDVNAFNGRVHDLGPTGRVRNSDMR